MPDATIQSISLYQLLMPLHEPFVISLGPLSQVRNLVVVLRTAGGTTGYGECPSTRHQAPGTKHQAPSTRHQAPSTKHQQPGTVSWAP